MNTSPVVIMLGGYRLEVPAILLFVLVSFLITAFVRCVRVVVALNMRSGTKKTKPANNNNSNNNNNNKVVRPSPLIADPPPANSDNNNKASFLTPIKPPPNQLLGREENGFELIWRECNGVKAKFVERLKEVRDNPNLKSPEWSPVIVGPRGGTYRVNLRTGRKSYSKGKKRIEFAGDDYSTPLASPKAELEKPPVHRETLTDASLEVLADTLCRRFGIEASLRKIASLEKQKNDASVRYGYAVDFLNTVEVQQRFSMEVVETFEAAMSKLESDVKEQTLALNALADKTNDDLRQRLQADLTAKVGKVEKLKQAKERSQKFLSLQEFQTRQASEIKQSYEEIEAALTLQKALHNQLVLEETVKKREVEVFTFLKNYDLEYWREPSDLDVSNSGGEFEEEEEAEENVKAGGTTGNHPTSSIPVATVVVKKEIKSANQQENDAVTE